MVLTYLERMHPFISALVSHENLWKMESQRQSLGLTILVVEQLQLITHILTGSQWDSSEKENMENLIFIMQQVQNAENNET